MKEAFEKIKEQFEFRKSYLSYNGLVVSVPIITFENAIEIVNQVAEEYGTDINVGSNDGWIPCSERLPEDGDCGFYMCIVENHEEDLPMFCQFEEEYGFGFRHDIYDEHTLGFVDSEFRTNEELGYEKVIAWMPLPAPYKPKGEK